MALSTGQATAGNNFADAMKTFYLAPLNDQVVRATVLLDRLEKSGEDVSGNFAYIPLIKTRNPGVGSRKDTAGVGPTLPVIGSQAYGTATFRMAMHYGRGGVTGPVMRASKNNAGAFAQALDVEMKGLTQRLPEDLNRQAWSYGHGRAASIDTVVINAKTTCQMSSKAIFNCKVGDRVHFNDITSGSDPMPAAGTTITAIARDTNAAGAASSSIHTVTLAAAVGASSATPGVAAMYYGSAQDATTVADAESSRAQEMFGIPSVVDDGNLGADETLGATTTSIGEAAEFIAGSLNYGGIARTNAFWQSKILKNPSSAGTNRSLTVSMMEEAFLNSITVGGATEASMEIYSNPGIWATFGLLHIGDRIFNDFKETFEGGWIALKFNGRPFFYDRDAPRDMIWFLDMSSLVFLTQSGYEFMDEDGSIMSRVSNRDAYEFTLYRDCQIGCRNASKNTLLDDVSTVFNVEANS